MTLTWVGIGCASVPMLPVVPEEEEQSLRGAYRARYRQP